MMLITMPCRQLAATTAVAQQCLRALIVVVGAELNEEQEMVVNQAVRGGSADQVLVEGFKLQICRRDIVTLSGLNWLNDEVCVSYLTLLYIWH